MPEPRLPVVLYRLNENINAIGAAVEELAIWIELQHGDSETAALVKSHLQVLVRNSDVIVDALAELITEEN
ncbi:hypothetical protein ACKI1H_16935 [Pseudomonas sp. YH-1]|uniref:hypothetical protein n=1 Tax=Pseudomonas sp. YH-1 TaxID=3384787 RepID=UPI003F82106E